MLARQMEVFAGFLEHTDHHVGRLVDALAELEILDDTLVYYIIGDNGASAEGTLNGSFNELLSLNGAAALETPSSWRRGSTSSAPPRPTTMRSAGPMPWTRRISGPSRSASTGRDPQRHHPPLAGRDPGQGEGPASSTTSSTWRPRCWRWPAARADQRPWRAAAAPARGQHGLLL